MISGLLIIVFIAQDSIKIHRQSIIISFILNKTRRIHRTVFYLFLLKSSKTYFEMRLIVVIDLNLKRCPNIINSDQAVYTCITKQQNYINSVTIGH